MSLEERVAVVTGGRRGIGKAIACLLAERGAHIVIADRQGDEAAEAAEQITASCGTRTLAVPTDVSNHESSQKLIEKTPVKPYKMNDSVELFDLADTENLANMQPNPKVQAPVVKPGAKSIQHTVVKGDTMYNISKRYGVTADQVRQWNNMPDNNVKLGQVLLINP